MSAEVLDSKPEVARLRRYWRASITYNCYKCSIAYREAMSRILPPPIASLVHQMAHRGRMPLPMHTDDFYWHVKCCMADRPKLEQYVKNFKRPKIK
jgi:hypothetical protein